jgi:hypothetical protein
VDGEIKCIEDADAREASAYAVDAERRLDDEPPNLHLPYTVLYH